ncbi:MAG: HypC/HybG/HupF family hydrogenase formation chaperone [Candidatus Cloacimonetes bacterium]|nr:HypC/HybG/HupF family hydrogenase formation chaperone [Candidatus Cloacimonadota bacterium]
MCLAIPAIVVKKTHNDMGIVCLGGVEKEISLMFTPEVRIGDWVMLHTDFAIQIITEEDARETLAIFQEIPPADQREEKI